MACNNVITNVPPAGQAPPANPHNGGAYIRWESCGSWKFWTDEVNANCHGIYNLKSINCIPLIDFLTTPLQVDVDANGHIIYNVGKIIIGSSIDDGSGALLQVAGEINAESYMVGGVEFANASEPTGGIDLGNITEINGVPIGCYLPTGPLGSIQWNNNGCFAGDAFLIYDPITHKLGVNPIGLGPQWQLDVGGDVNIIDPTYLGYAYRINGIPFAIADPSGSHINLINIGLINGAPPGSGGGGGASPGGVQGNVQFNSGGLFAGSNNLFWDNTNNRLGIGTASPQYPLDVVGNVNTSGCYFINHVPFACVDGSGISLQNITTINGGPPGGAALNLLGGACIQIDKSIPGTNIIAVNKPCAQSPVVTNINGGNFDMTNVGNVTVNGCYYIGATNPVSLCNDGSGNLLVNGAPISGGASVTVSPTPPTTPSGGNLWFDSTDTQLYIWYEDPTSNQWVPVINQCGLIGDAPADGNLYGRENGSWTQITATGGGGTPSAPNGSVQWNNNGAFGGTSNLTWDATNIRLGIGTVSPQALLHLATPSGNTQLEIQAAGSGAPYVSFIGGSQQWIAGLGIGTPNDFYIWDQTRTASVIMAQAGTGNVGIGTTSPQVMLDMPTYNTTNTKMRIGSMEFSGYALNNSYITDNLYFNGVYFTYRNTGYGVLLQTNGGDFEFGTAPSGTAGTTVTPTNRMTITNAGNVGIGTTNPLYSLDVHGTIQSAQANPGSIGGVLILNNGGGAAEDYSQLMYQSGGIDRAWIRSTAHGADGYQGTVEFWTGLGGSSTPMTEKMRISGNGNVGIGTTNPAAGLLELNKAVDGGYHIAFDVGGVNQWGVFAQGSTHNFNFDSLTAPAKTVLTLTANGNVGIGTASPASPLDVSGLMSCTYLGGHSGTSYNACLTVQSDRGLPGAPPNNTMSFTYTTGNHILQIVLTDASGNLHTANITMT